MAVLEGGVLCIQGAVDVSGAVAAHNADAQAHPELRQAVEQIQSGEISIKVDGDSSTLQVKRLEGDAPILAAGELAIDVAGRQPYIGTGGENLELVTGEQLDTALAGKAGKSAVVAVALPADGWAGEAAPYSQEVQAPGVTTENHLVVAQAADATAEQREAWGAGTVLATGQGDGTLTFTAAGDRPGVDLVATVMIVG